MLKELVNNGGIQLQCGAKCFIVEMIVDGKKIVQKVNARTPINARKTIRATFGKNTPILSVKEAVSK